MTTSEDLSDKQRETLRAVCRKKELPIGKTVIGGGVVRFSSSVVDALARRGLVTITGPGPDGGRWFQPTGAGLLLGLADAAPAPATARFQVGQEVFIVCHAAQSGEGLTVPATVVEVPTHSGDGMRCEGPRRPVTVALSNGERFGLQERDLVLVAFAEESDG